MAQQYVGAGFTLVITAYDGSDNVLTGFNGTLALVDSTGTLLPATWSTWSNGVATVLPATINQPRAGDVITATASGVLTHSNLFDVVWNPAGTVLLDVRPASIAMGRTAHVTATVLDGSGNLDVAPKQVTFSADKGVMSPQVATTSGGIATTVFTGTAPGRGIITATLDSGALGNATIIIQPPLCLPLVMRSYKPYVPPANGPDLVITGISVTPSAPAAGQSATVRVTVRNQGNRAASTWFFVHLYTDRAPTGRSDVDGKWAYGPSSLAVGASAQVSIDTTFTAGAHNLYAQTDTYWGYGSPDYGNVQETNENNNVFGPFPLNVSGVAVDMEQTLPPSPGTPPPEPTSEP